MYVSVWQGVAFGVIIWRKRDSFPEVKDYLDGSEFIVVKEGFSLRDLKIIAEIIFNDSSTGEMTNDLYLLQIWEKLHGKS